jgi:hypothetical protein|tara:strand:+ start:1163 stop:2212 length:1050 start_codon:yes stop_codon:yes gene_type:complete
MGDDDSGNLRKFLESDDPAMMGMGLSMAKGSADASGQTLGLILGLYMFHSDKEIRSLAKTAFTKLAPSIPKGIVRKYWQAEFRTQSWVWEGGWMQKMVSEVDEAGINPVYLLTRALVMGDEGTKGVIIGILGKIEVVDESSTVVVASLVQMISGSTHRYSSQNNSTFTNEKAAIAVIEKFGGDQAVDALAGLLGSNLGINEVVADALGTLGDVRAVEPLIGVLRNDSKAVVRALGILGDARAVGPLIGPLERIFDSYRSYYSRQDPNVFIEALVKLGDEKAIKPLVRGLDNERLGARERTNIAEAISSLLKRLEIDTKEKENLNRFLTGSDPGMRAMGISMLKGMTNSS